MSGQQNSNYYNRRFDVIPSIKSWEDFYESYDGKFDEKHMLHITIHAHQRLELERLGYKPQNEEDDWHKPVEGEYKLDDEGNLIIIHSCPDREIFQMDIKEFLEELLINQDWVSDASLTIM